MINRRSAAQGWPRLFVALLALACMLARAALPLPAQAQGFEGTGSDLRALGATICHTGEAPDQQTPGGAPACDHCPVCAFAFDLHALAPDLAAPPAFAVLADNGLPAGFNAQSIPRGPPRRAHSPTGPPATL